MGRGARVESETMTEEARLIRNSNRLGECFPAFRDPLRRVLGRLEQFGFRPRIQDAYRSPEDELAAYKAGNSQVKRGFHSCIGQDGRTEALAADVLDDDAPLHPSNRYVFMLAWCARQEGLRTGVLWGLAPEPRAVLDGVINAGPPFTRIYPYGWDACHVETTEVTVAEALAGKRPPAAEVHA
jgi:hypothetical protein